MPVKPAVYARNNMAGPTVMSFDAKGNHSVTWEGKGAPSGGDVQMVPDELAHSVQFLQAVQRGVITLENGKSADTKDAIQRQRDTFQALATDQQKQAEALIDRQENRTIVALDCVGPGSREGASCANKVTVSELKKNDQAPLCSTHEHLRSMYIPVPTQVGAKVEIKWNRVVVDPPQRQE